MPHVLRHRDSPPTTRWGPWCKDRVWIPGLSEEGFYFNGPFDDTPCTVSYTIKAAIGARERVYEPGQDRKIATVLHKL